MPRVEREEFVNASVIAFCLDRKVPRALFHVDPIRLMALWPALELELGRQHLEAFPEICGGDVEGGPIARLTARERFHWLVAPRGTMIQISPVHSGLCESPESALHETFRQMVLL